MRRRHRGDVRRGLGDRTHRRGDACRRGRRSSAGNKQVFVTDPLLCKQVFGTVAPETFRSELDVAPPREFAKRHESAETRLKADAIVSSTWVACHVARVGGNVVNRQS